MKLRILFFILSICSLAFTAENLSLPSLGSIQDPADIVQNQLNHLDALSEATQQSLNNQLALRKLIVDYRKIQIAYLQNPNDNEILFKMMKAGDKLLKSIKENHLLQTFDPEFLSELTVMSQYASKKGIPKP